MNLTQDRVRSIGWAFVLTICLALTVALTLRVNAVRGQVVEAERRIVSMKRDIQFLEIEFQARANQQQLASLNDVEFGYVAPGAGQYIEGERQLAVLGKERAPGAPSPIRMAHAVTETRAIPFMAMVSPLTGKPVDNGDAAKPAAVKSAASQPAIGKLAVAGPAEAGSAKNHDASAADAGGDVVGSAIASASLGTRLARIELAKGRDE